MFEYTKDVREQSWSGIKAGVILIVVGFVGLLPGIFRFGDVRSFWVFLSPDVFIFGSLGLIFLTVGLFILTVSILRVTAGGKWHVKITDSELTWIEPRYANWSFKAALTDLACLKRTRRLKTKRSGRVKESVSYALVLNNGKEHGLLNQFDMDMDAFVAALAKVGVEIVYEDMKVDTPALL